MYVYEGTPFSTFSPTFGIFCLLNSKYPKGVR